MKRFFVFEFLLNINGLDKLNKSLNLVIVRSQLRAGGTADVGQNMPVISTMAVTETAATGAGHHPRRIALILCMLCSDVDSL